MHAFRKATLTVFCFTGEILFVWVVSREKVMDVVVDGFLEKVILEGDSVC